MLSFIRALLTPVQLFDRVAVTPSTSWVSRWYYAWFLIRALLMRGLCVSFFRCERRSSRLTWNAAWLHAEMRFMSMRCEWKVHLSWFLSCISACKEKLLRCNSLRLDSSAKLTFALVCCSFMWSHALNIISHSFSCLFELKICLHSRNSSETLGSLYLLISRYARLNRSSTFNVFMTVCLIGKVSNCYIELFANFVTPWSEFCIRAWAVSQSSFVPFYSDDRTTSPVTPALLE